MGLRQTLALLIHYYEGVSPFGGLITVTMMARRLLRSPTMTIIHLVAIGSLLLLLAPGRGIRASMEEDDLPSCPIECDCKGLTVDCAHRGLTRIPHHLPTEARRL